jgi:Ca-activated chloride channel family protein
MNPPEFASPVFLFLLIPWLVLGFFAARSKNKNHLFFTGSGAPEPIFKSSVKSVFFQWIDVLRWLALGAFIIALARPRSVDLSVERSFVEGIDIVLSIDLSASMLARDFQPDRLGASKAVAREFILGRPSDRIGLVAFARESYTACPLTTDHRILLDALEGLEHGKIEDGTAIGMGLASAVNRLKDTPGKSKVAILVTDGVNNSGAIDPETALVLAKETGLRVYAIGVGTRGMAPTPYAYSPGGGLLFRNAPVEIDEALLQRLADETGGAYYRATDNSSLDQVYREIDQLEQKKIEETRYLNYTEHYRQLVLLSALLLLVDGLLRTTWLKSALG